MEGNGFSLQDRVAVVTGGGQSLGLAVSRALHGAGAKLVIAEVNDETGPDVAEELEGTFVHTDVTDPASVRNVAMLSEHGRIDFSSTTPDRPHIPSRRGARRGVAAASPGKPSTAVLVLARGGKGDARARPVFSNRQLAR